MLVKLFWVVAILSLEGRSSASFSHSTLGVRSMPNLGHPSTTGHCEPAFWLWQITLLVKSHFSHAIAAIALVFQVFWFCFVFKYSPIAWLLKSLLFTGVCVSCQLSLSCIIWESIFLKNVLIRNVFRRQTLLSLRLLPLAVWGK